MSVENKESNFISAVAYLHEEAALVKPFLERVCGALAGRFRQFEVILVDDASRDGSVEAVREFVQESPWTMPVTVVHMSVYQGIELCMNAGIDLAIGDFVFEFDTLELPDGGALFDQAYDTALAGFDIVSVCPQKNRRGPSGLFYRVFNRFSRSRYAIGTDLFHVLSRRAINRVHAICGTAFYRKAAYAASGLRMKTLRVPGTVGRAANKPLRVSIALDSLALYTDAGYKLSCGVAGLMLLATLAELLYTLAVYLGGGQPVEGWTTTMLVLTAGFFGVFLILAMVLKYLSLLVDLIFRHQRYLVEGIEKLQK